VGGGRYLVPVGEFCALFGGVIEKADDEEDEGEGDAEGYVMPKRASCGGDCAADKPDHEGRPTSGAYEGGDGDDEGEDRNVE
jgi:hypothetical protein